MHVTSSSSVVHVEQVNWADFAPRAVSNSRMIPPLTLARIVFIVVFIVDLRVASVRHRTGSSIQELTCWRKNFSTSTPFAQHGSALIFVFVTGCAAQTNTKGPAGPQCRNHT